MPDESKQKEGSKKIRAVIDRIEDGEIAVLSIGEEGEVSVDWPSSLLPRGASEGDHLQISITLDADSRREAETRVKDLQERLAARSGTKGQKDFKL
ncbi:MAG TPA: DUF3006 domain-containing protein [Pyrinomonadaceae bacterium]|jgi:hypothetical protein